MLCKQKNGKIVLEDFIYEAEKRLRFSIFFCGCKQSKSLHILRCKSTESISNNKIMFFKKKEKQRKFLPFHFHSVK